MGEIKININRLIAKNGLSKNAVAKATDYHRTQFNKYCANKIQRFDLTFLARLCEVLNCEAGDILEYVPPERMEKDK